MKAKPATITAQLHHRLCVFIISSSMDREACRQRSYPCTCKHDRGGLVFIAQSGCFQPRNGRYQASEKFVSWNVQRVTGLGEISSNVRFNSRTLTRGSPKN